MDVMYGVVAFLILVIAIVLGRKNPSRNYWVEGDDDNLGIGS